MAIPFKIRLLLWQDRFFGKRTERMPPKLARETSSKFYQKVVDRIDFPAIKMSSVENVLISTRDQYQIKSRIYRPSEESSLPVILFFHGGGFVIYDLESHDRVCRRIAKTTNSIVVSVDYRLAPEYKFPVPAEDCYDSLNWTFSNINTFGGDPQRISVAGDSAGGTLATVTCLMSKELSGPGIRGQILIYPTVDATLHLPSIDRYGKGYFLSKVKMQWFVNHYARSEKDKTNPYMSPYFQEDLIGLPPALVITAQYDPLVDEGAAYAQKLKNAGVNTKYIMYEGMIHGFINMPKLANPALAVHQEINSFLSEIDSY